MSAKFQFYKTEDGDCRLFSMGKTIELNKDLFEDILPGSIFNVRFIKLPNDYDGPCNLCLWVARDASSDGCIFEEGLDSDLFIYRNFPKQYEDGINLRWSDNDDNVKGRKYSVLKFGYNIIHKDLFPEVRFEDGPQLYRMWIIRSETKDDFRKG